METTYPRTPTSVLWIGDDTLREFTAEASQLGMLPGVHPCRSPIEDPWQRPLPKVEVAWTTHRRGSDDVTHWTCTVRAPDGTAVSLTVYND